jgi:predicted RNase H-like nuclease
VKSEPTDTTFVGLDFAWRGEKRPSGIAVFRGDRDGARLSDVRVIQSTDVLAYVKGHTEERIVVAIDAPLIISNKSGQRPCEKLIGKKYGARHGSAHTSNLSRFPDAASVRLATQLVALGFKHAPEVSSPGDERIILEVYPHSALLELFSLDRIIKYKKGCVGEKRRGQQEIQSYLRRLSSLSPPIISTPKLSAFLRIDTGSLKGAKLKENEDQLDSILCAYIAYYYWYWCLSHTRMFGDLTTGYIIVPAPSGNMP